VKAEHLCTIIVKCKENVYRNYSSAHITILSIMLFAQTATIQYMGMQIIQ